MNLFITSGIRNNSAMPAQSDIHATRLHHSSGSCSLQPLLTRGTFVRMDALHGRGPFTIPKWVTSPEQSTCRTYSSIVPPPLFKTNLTIPAEKMATSYRFKYAGNQ